VTDPSFPQINFVEKIHLDVVCLPSVAPNFKRMSRVLSRYNTKTVGILFTKVASLLRPIKDELGLKTSRMNWTWKRRAFKASTAGMGRITFKKRGRSIETRIKGHHRHIRLYHPEKLTVTEHSMNLSPASWHQRPGQKVRTYGSHDLGSDIDWAPSW